MDIKIRGSGCAKCQTLAQVTHDAVDQLGLEAEFEKVTDPGEIASWGVMATPALVTDDQVVVSVRVPTVDDIKKLLVAR
jgi:small redox-active disulfide protein 2